MNKKTLSLSDEILLLLSDQPLTFASIRDTLEAFGYDNRKVIWATLERLVQKGLLNKSKNRETTVFSITKAGKNALPKEPTFIPTPDRAWDRKWRIVVFDIPEKMRQVRNKFTMALREKGYARFQNSVYLTVHDNLDEVEKLAKELNIENQILTLTAEQINIRDQQNFAKKIWNLDELNESYRKFVEENKNGYKGGDYTSEILRHWLKRTKYEYLSILHRDPVLPKELLPNDWQGWEAKKVWQQMERILETY